MGRQLLILALVILSFQCVLTAQDTIPNYDTSYIESYRDYLVVTLLANWNANSINIEDNVDEDVTYSTDNPWHFGFSVDYKWFTLELSKSFSPDYDEHALAATETKSIGFGYTGRKFWFRNFWKQYKGYYLQNPEYFNSNFDPLVDTFPKRPDLETKIYFANLNYGFNYRRFSNTASLWQLEKQKRSAGSFTAGLSFAYIEYQADSALIPTGFRQNFNPDVIVRNYHFILFGINAGYLHTFAMFRKKRLFLSLALIPGVSYQTGESTLEDNRQAERKSGIGGQTELRFVLGYNHQRWYTSFSGNLYVISNNFAKENNISHDYSFVRFMLGYKIKVRPAKSELLKKIGF